MTSDGAGIGSGEPGLVRRARRLEYVTIGWNLSEAATSIGLGIAAGSLALIGFGADSFIEVFASVVVVWHLAGDHGDERHHARTRTALRLVGWAFALLAVALSAASLRDLITGRRPDESVWGIVYIAIAAVVMFVLAVAKRRTADALDSAPLRAEAAMSLLDGILATTTMLGLLTNATLGWWWADPSAALVVAAVAANEARENWEEAEKYS